MTQSRKWPIRPFALVIGPLYFTAKMTGKISHQSRSVLCNYRLAYLLLILYFEGDVFRYDEDTTLFFLPRAHERLKRIYPRGVGSPHPKSNSPAVLHSDLTTSYRVLTTRERSKILGRKACPSRDAVWIHVPCVVLSALFSRLSDEAKPQAVMLNKQIRFCICQLGETTSMIKEKELQPNN